MSSFGDPQAGSTSKHNSLFYSEEIKDLLVWGMLMVQACWINGRKEMTRGSISKGCGWVSHKARSVGEPRGSEEGSPLLLLLFR